ncbi:MAG: carbohydrate-binding family 6 protein [Opitutales bacterium]
MIPLHRLLGRGLTICLHLVTSYNLYSNIIFDESIEAIAFAASKIKQVPAASEPTIIFEIQEDPNQPESFSIQKSQSGEIRIIGTDPAGAMYGGFEVAEILSGGGLDDIQPHRQSPDMRMRGVKLNIPLDARTPSYSDMGDAAQHNIPHMWDMSFWEDFIDEVAYHRYNYISLWSLHPFPSLVKPPNYPDIALDDVKRAVDLEKKYYDGRGRNFDSDDILDELETVLEISINEKIEFWRKVMRYGKSRNVDFYFVTWNVFDYGTEGKYGIDDSLENPETKKYFRESVKELFLTYPDLKGIGITTGENMHDASDQAKEDWMFETYGMAVLDAVSEQPNREITFLHRQHQAGAQAIADTFKPLIEHPQIDFLFSFKYAQAHAYSAVEQPFYQRFARDIEDYEQELKTIWTMRNDSTYLFRWAAPDFLRTFVQNIPKDITEGYYFGSDGWVWGREHIRKNHPKPNDLEIRKHWFQWMLWGRLAYDSELSNDRFVNILQSRFPSIDARSFLQAWQGASMLYPLVTGFNWGSLDYRWYPEACMGVPNAAKSQTGFYSVDRFITMGDHPGAGNASIPEYAKALKSGTDLKGRAPLYLSEQLLENAASSLEYLESIPESNDWELSETSKDIEAMAYLGRYYGYKIKGATHLHLYREFGKQADQDNAIEALKNGAQAWRSYLANINERYIHPMWLARIRTGPIDFNRITEWVDNDITIAQSAEPN